LDPESSDAVFGIIADLKARGKSIVLVEHKMDLVAQYADRVIALSGGRVILEGPTSEVFTSPVLVDADIARPEVTELAEALAREGRALARTPVTRAEAAELIGARMKGGRRADRA
jgi:energy-coupling factor transport system ATP-binding protein